MENSDNSEIDRIKQEYTKREESGVSELYTYSNPAYSFHMKEREEAMLKLFTKHNVRIPGTDVFEVGCGTGEILQQFLDWGAKSATGMDLLEDRIELAKKQYPHIKFLHGNAAKIPLGDNSFDLILNFMCFSSIIDSQMRGDIAKDLWRILKPGRFILSYDFKPVFKPIDILSKIYYEHKSKKGSPNPKTSLRPVSRADIKELFPSGIVNSRSVSLLFILAGLSKHSKVLARFLSGIPLLRTHYLILIQKPVSDPSEAK